FSSLGLFRVIVVGSALGALGFPFPIQFLTRPKHVGDGQLVEASVLDRLPDADVKLDISVAAFERRATEMTPGPESERRLEELLNLPQCERDEELLLIIRTTQSRVALLAPERANEAHVENARRLNRGGRRVIHGENCLHALVGLRT